MRPYHINQREREDRFSLNNWSAFTFWFIAQPWICITFQGFTALVDKSVVTGGLCLIANWTIDTLADSKDELVWWLKILLCGQHRSDSDIFLTVKIRVLTVLCPCKLQTACIGTWRNYCGLHVKWSLTETWIGDTRNGQRTAATSCRLHQNCCWSWSLKKDDDVDEQGCWRWCLLGRSHPTCLSCLPLALVSVDAHTHTRCSSKWTRVKTGQQLTHTVTQVSFSGNKCPLFHLPTEPVTQAGSALFHVQLQKPTPCVGRRKRLNNFVQI